MSQQQLDRWYLYRASSVAFGGALTRPVPQLIPARATAALPLTGGEASARSKRFRLRDALSYEAARAVVSGSENQHGEFSTLAYAIVDRLDILGVVTADRIIARLASRHAGKPEGPPEFTSAGSAFENLRIAGRRVDLKCNASQLANVHNYRSLTKDHASLLAEDLLPAGACGDQLPRTRGGFVPLRLFDCGADSFGRPTNRIYIPQFGIVYFGELHVYEYSVRLSMLRIELGCAYEGRLCAATVETNGMLGP